MVYHIALSLSITNEEQDMINPNGINLKNMKTEDFDNLISSLTKIMEDAFDVLDADTVIGASEYRDAAKEAFKEYE